MSLVHAVVPAERTVASPRLEDLRRVERLDRSRLTVVTDGRDNVANATSGWAARLALRVAKDGQVA
ncbi:MAG: hypothetical protein CVU56_11570 [Deltaproteobacteria bacterium HGW-Deltaproteobacteria-14]|jgi:hypothetical protein|nr:MAG: hypothetical protein CVU56_11570 [Deltaproteobacteria bacterium HGW-Deltaproteobacteria-14]